MKIYLIRHGKSQDAEAGISQRWDSRLSESAKQQIITLKTEFQKIPFNKIYHSPWPRAKQTAELLFTDTKFPLEEVEYIHEYRKPRYLEGLSHSSAEKFWAEYSENTDNPDWKLDNSESFNDTLKRVEKLKRLLLSHKDTDTIGVVSHSIIFNSLIGYWLMGENFNSRIFCNLLQHIHLDNLGYILIETDKEKIDIRRWHNW